VREDRVEEAVSLVHDAFELERPVA